MRNMTSPSLEQILLEWPVSNPITGIQLQHILPLLSEEIRSSPDVQPIQLVVLFCEERALEPTQAETYLLGTLSTLIRILNSYLAGELTGRVMVDLFEQYYRIVGNLAPKARATISTYLERILMDADRYPDLEKEKKMSGFVDDKKLFELMTDAKAHYIDGWNRILAKIEKRSR